MLAKFREWKYVVLAFLIATVGKNLIRLLLLTCRWEVFGLEEFVSLAKKEKCILMLWHNRLAVAPFILHHYAPFFTYTALVSNSQDGKLLQAVIHAFKEGATISVAHNQRYQALRKLINHIRETQDVVIITPDGPKGPPYQVKPGIAIAALETGAYVVPLSWESSAFWELSTWDKLRIPKPFSKIQIFFEPAIQFHANKDIKLKTAQAILNEALPY